MTESSAAPDDLLAAADAPGTRPPLMLNVGFTGHRLIADEAAAAASLADAFARIAAAFGMARTPALMAAYDGAPALRLIAGAAPGADRLAAAAWRSGGFGETHLIYPFRDPETPDGAYTDDPAENDLAARVPPPLGKRWTGLDAAGLGLARNAAHAEVAGWIVRHADLLVAWWNGAPGQGEGGTFDTLAHALGRGLPVIWIGPGHGARLIDPARAADPSGAELPAITEPLDDDALAAILAPPLTPPREPAPGDAVRLATQLRIARATWPLGFDVADDRNAPATDWPEWRVRAALRAASPPRGWITRVSFEHAAQRAAAALTGMQPSLALGDLGPMPYLAALERLRRAAEDIVRSEGG